MITIIGTLGIETVYQYPNNFSLRMMGHGYDIALALAHIQEPCIFISGSAPGHFSQFLLMDAQENNFNTEVEDVDDLGLAGSLHYLDEHNVLHRQTAYPIYEKGISYSFLKEKTERANHLFVEMGFPLEMLKYIFTLGKPVSLVIRQKSDSFKLASLLEYDAQIASIWSLGIKNPGFSNFACVDGSHIHIEENGVQTDYIIESDAFVNRSFDIFSLVVAATSSQQISWEMGIDECFTDCIPLLETAAPIHIDKQVFAFDRKFTAYFKSVENLEHDHLTGLKNRAAVEKVIEKMLHSETNFCAFIVDVDHFKSVNDTYGHDAGDMVLSAVAREIQKNLRTEDVGCRWGGEEFVVLLPNTPIHAAHKIAERLRECMENMSVPIPRKITASFGVARHLPSETFKQMLERADKALYHAKHHGRNQVCIANED